MLRIDVYVGLIFAAMAGMLAMHQEFGLAVMFMFLAGLTAHGLIFPQEETDGKR